MKPSISARLALTDDWRTAEAVKTIRFKIFDPLKRLETWPFDAAGLAQCSMHRGMRKFDSFQDL